MKPGDTFTGDSGQEWVLGPLIAYQGRPGCADVRCSRLNGECVGYHCPDSDKPVGSQGHKCPERGEA